MSGFLIDWKIPGVSRPQFKSTLSPYPFLTYKLFRFCQFLDRRFCSGESKIIALHLWNWQAPKIALVLMAWGWRLNCLQLFKSQIGLWWPNSRISLYGPAWKIGHGGPKIWKRPLVSIIQNRHNCPKFTIGHQCPKAKNRPLRSRISNRPLWSKIQNLKSTTNVWGKNRLLLSKRKNGPLRSKSQFQPPGSKVKNRPLVSKLGWEGLKS